MSTAVVAPRVDFYFDVVCPYAYLAHAQIQAVCARGGVQLVWRPILLGGLYRIIGGAADPNAAMSPAKARMTLKDMARWAEHLDIPLVMPRGHPNRTVLAMRAVVASGDTARAAKALFAAYWRDGADVSDESVVRRALDAVELDGSTLVRRANDPDVKQGLFDSTDEAARMGAFGVPTFVVHGGIDDPELFWGQDRLHFVEATARRRARSAA